MEKNKQINKLIKILEQEYELYHELYKLASSKKEAIIENNVQELNNLIEKDEKVINSFNQLESERNQLLDDLKDNYNLETENLNYSRLIKELSDPWKEKMTQIRNKLLDVIDKLNQQNEQNKVLLKEAIKLNNFSYKMIAQILEPDNKTYKKDKKDKDERINHIIDRKA